MKDIKTLKEKINISEGRLERQNMEDIVEIFIESLYQPILKENSYSIISIEHPKDKNFKKFMEINKKLVYKYANNIKKNYDEKLLDPENEYANISIYIVESLYIFFKNHCNEDVETFKLYIEDSNKTYTNSEGKEYIFSKFMYMAVDRMIKEENKLHEKSIEKGNMKETGKFARIHLDATTETEDGKEKDIELYSMGLFTLIREDDGKTDKEILEDDIKEITRVQNKLYTVLTKAQVEFIVTETYGCYYDIDKEDFIKKIYTKQQRNQFFNQISKRINRDIKPFFIKKHNEKYVDDMIKYRRENKKVLEVRSVEKVEECINQHSNFFVSNVKIND